MPDPRPARQRIPDRDEYGTPDETPPEHALPWSTVEKWLEEARYYWIATTRRDGRPTTVAVWAVWLDGYLYFSTSPETATAQNLAANPQAIAHTESAVEVVMLEGTAARLTGDRVSARVVDAYENKYGWRLDPADAGMPFFALTPRVARSWLAENVRGTAVRWLF